MHNNLKQPVSHQQQSPLMRHPHVHSAITKSHPPLHLLLKLVSLWIFKYSKSSGRWTSPCDLINKKDRQLQTTNGWALLSSFFIYSDGNLLGTVFIAIFLKNCLRFVKDFSLAWFHSSLTVFFTNSCHILPLVPLVRTLPSKEMKNLDRNASSRYFLSNGTS